MHYYKFHIADYRKDTAHLCPIEHYIYRSLIDLYYLDEQPIKDETQWVLRRLCLGTEHLKNLENVLSDFFVLVENHWVHKRIEMEIKEYANITAKNQLNGKKGGRPKKTHSVISGMPDVTLTSNHKPITNNHIKNIGRGSRLPQDWIVPEDYIKFCHEERPDLIAEDVALQFKDYWISVAGAKGVKTDWFATWRNWVRRQDVAKSKFKNKGSLMSDAQFEDWLTPKGVEYARIG